MAIGASLCLGVVLVGVYFFRLSMTNGITAEPAGYLLYAADMVRGNWLLRGWTFPEDPYWFPDGILYGVGSLLLGVKSVLLYIVPTIIALLFVAVVFVAATAGLKTVSPLRLTLPLVAVLPIVFPSPAMITQVLMGPYHTGTTVVAIAAALALSRAQQPVRKSMRQTLVGLALVLLTAGEISDPYTTALIIVPIALVSLLYARNRQDSKERRIYMLPLIVASTAWISAHAGMGLVERLGGATVIPFIPSTVPYSNMGASLQNFVLALLELSGGDIFGQPIGINLVPPLLRFALLAGGFWAAWLGLRGALFGSALLVRGGGWLTSVLAASAGLSLVGNILGTSNLDLRYRLPFFIMATVVFARRFGVTIQPWVARKKALAVTLTSLVVLAYMVAPLQHWKHTGMSVTSDSPPALLGQWLEAHGLKYGYGGYWEASIVTVESRGAVEVRPVVSTKIDQPGLGPSPVPPAQWRLTPFNWMSKKAWYSAEHPSRFVVFDPNSQWDRDTGVNLEIATQTFGHPDHIYESIGTFTVLVWNRPFHL